VVLALTSGGVPVACEVARTLAAPLDVLVVRKLGVPQHPHLAIGAIAGADAVYLDRELLATLVLPQVAIDEAIAREQVELVRRHAMFCGNRPPLALAGRIAIVVDDGIVTGASMQVALRALRAANPEWIVVAVPVGPDDAADRVGTAADELVCVLGLPDFRNLPQCYRDFSPVTDEQVRSLLKRPL